MKTQRTFKLLSRQVARLWLSLVLLSLLSLAVFTQAAAKEAAADAFLALPAAGHCLILPKETGISGTLAANPELSSACRYAAKADNTVKPAAGVAAKTGIDFRFGLAEALAARQDQARTQSGLAASVTSLAENPELLLARQYTAMQATTDKVVAANSAFLAQNPELMLAGRYVPTTEPETNSLRFGLSEFLATQSDISSEVIVAADVEYNRFYPGH